MSDSRKRDHLFTDMDDLVDWLDEREEMRKRRLQKFMSLNRRESALKKSVNRFREMPTEEPEKPQ